MQEFKTLVQQSMKVRGSIPRIPWSKLAPAIVDGYDQGMHSVIFGKTGSGKTVLALDFLSRLNEQRDAYVMTFGYKLRDKSLTSTGWPIISHFPPKYEDIEPGHKVILWAPYSSPSTAADNTRPIFEEALDDMMHEGNWTIFVDELQYFVETLNLRRNLSEYWNGARSSGISLIAGTQRPAYVPRAAVSQIELFISFRLEDEDDRKRAGEIFGDKQFFSEAIGTLQRDKFEFIIVHEDVAAISWIDYDPSTIYKQGKRSIYYNRK